MYVHSSRLSELVDLVRERTERLVVGTKSSPETDIGPLIREAEAERIALWIQEAEEAGATVVTGGQRDGAFVTPTVLTDVPEDARVLREEVFGPVVSILSFTEIDDAIQRVNDTEYGLQAGIFTASMPTAFKVVDRLHMGTVLVNETSDFRIDSMPFGGSKRSGVGREGVPAAILELSEPKNIILNNIG